MDIFDLFLTPVYLLIFYALAFYIRPKVTSKTTRKYFIPALSVKFIGAIALGLIYQFYYGNLGNAQGDTFNYYFQAKILYQAFLDSPIIWWNLLISHGEYNPITYSYATHIFWYTASSEFFIVKITSFFAVLSFNTYTVIALYFALFSFSGMWALYITFLKIKPNLIKQLSIAVFFLPSVFFWGSGLMKDSVTLGSLGWLMYGFYKVFIEKLSLATGIFIIILTIYIIYSVKIYILLSFLPPAFFWIFNENSSKIKNKLIRIVSKPFFLFFGLVIAYSGATNLTKGNEKYDIDNIGERSKINTLYLSKQIYSGSAYDIGIFDGTLKSIIEVGPRAINVSLFRPYIWEVRSFVMLLSAVEATFFLFLSLWLIFQTGIINTLKLIISQPIINFCIIFSLILGFAVGTNSGNFGTLVRYKIPLMPFYLSALFFMKDYIKNKKYVLKHN